jgi:hypothetical protein
LFHPSSQDFHYAYGGWPEDINKNKNNEGTTPR